MSAQGLKMVAIEAATILEHHATSGYMSGAVALIGRGERAEVLQFGTTAAGEQKKMQRDSIFRIASMTKPITATAAMMLVDARHLHLEDPVTRWLPELAHRRVLTRIDAALDDTVAAKRPMTLEDLLTMRCGWGILLTAPQAYPIERRIKALQLIGFGPPDPAYPVGPDEWLKRLGTLPLMAEPGEEWLYNTGSYLLGVLLTRATGVALPELLRRLIFEPLGMKDTGFVVPPGARDRLVNAYQLEAGRLQLYDAAAASAWSSAPAFPDAGAGLVSTVDDYFLFARMLSEQGRAGRHRLLSEAAVAAMTRDHLSPSQRSGGAAILGSGRGWGFGMAVVESASDAGLPRGAYGWNGGLGTSWLSDPASGVSAILLTQTLFDSPVAPAVHQEFQRAVFAPAFL
jgi:CubicO group peptidase (beta-lactamase class C family)